MRHREVLLVGKFAITPIVSRHFQFPDPAMRERALGDPDITEPLVPPVGAFDYKVGEAYVLHVAHPKGSFPRGRQRRLCRRRAGRLFGRRGVPGQGGLGSQTHEYRAAYWRETVDAPTRDR